VIAAEHKIDVLNAAIGANVANFLYTFIENFLKFINNSLCKQFTYFTIQHRLSKVANEKVFY
ncbi:hypothetical protein P4403_23825, partial [Bacillus thuringiensis]